MEKFWAVILIFAIVAAGGLLYVNQVYAPQKDAQVAMAETANTTLTAVKMEMDNDPASATVSAQDVIDQVRVYCGWPNPINVVVNTGGSNVITYTNDSSNIASQIGSITNNFTKTSEYMNGKLHSVRYDIIENQQ